MTLILPPAEERKFVATAGSNADDFRVRAGSLVRQLAFAGLAVCWLFRSNEAGAPPLSAPLLRAAVLFVATLSLDILEHVVGLVIWGLPAGYILKCQDQSTAWSRFLFSVDTLNTTMNMVARPVRFVFWVKLIAAAGGYVVLFAYLFDALA